MNKIEKICLGGPLNGQVRLSDYYAVTEQSIVPPKPFEVPCDVSIKVPMTSFDVHTYWSSKIHSNRLGTYHVLVHNSIKDDESEIMKLFREYIKEINQPRRNNLYER